MLRPEPQTLLRSTHGLPMANLSLLQARLGRPCGLQVSGVQGIPGPEGSWEGARLWYPHWISVCVSCAIMWVRQGMPAWRHLCIWRYDNRGACDHVISRDRKPTPPIANRPGSAPCLGQSLQTPCAPSFPPLAFLRGEKLGFLLQWEGAARPAAVGASSDSALWGGVYEQPKWL